MRRNGELWIALSIGVGVLASCGSGQDATRGNLPDAIASVDGTHTDSEEAFAPTASTTTTTTAAPPTTVPTTTDLEEEFASPTTSTTTTTEVPSDLVPPPQVLTSPPANGDDRNLPGSMFVLRNPPPIVSSGWNAAPEIVLPQGCGPAVAIEVTPSKVRVGERVSVRVAASAEDGIHSIWWFLEGEGAPGSVVGAESVTEGWTRYGVEWKAQMNTPGTFTVVAQMRDLAYWGTTDQSPHQASEGCGLARFDLTVAP